MARNRTPVSTSEVYYLSAGKWDECEDIRSKLTYNLKLLFCFFSFRAVSYKGQIW